MKTGGVVIPLAALILLYTVLSYACTAQPSTSSKYTYYGKVPERLWRYDYTTRTGWKLGLVNGVYYGAGPASAFLLALGATEDGTKVEVYSLSNNSLILKDILSKFEKRYIVLSNGTVFKVVSTKPLSVLLLNLQSPPNATVGPVPHAFYPSIDGSYVGKRFVLLASSDLNPWYTIFALENTEVTITREDGKEQIEFKLKPNEYKRVMLRAWYMYTIESSGYIMVQCGNPHSYWDPYESYAIPAANGGFVGTDFFSFSNLQWDPREDVGFRVLALEDSNVVVYDLDGKRELMKFKVPAYSSVRFQAVVQAIRVSSDRPVQLMFLHEGDTTKSAGQQVTRENAYGAGLIFYTIPGGRTAAVYLPVNATSEAIIYASEPTRVTIDGLTTVRLGADEYYVLTQPGLHTIAVDKNVVVQVIHWPKQPEFQGLWVSGTVLPAIETADVTVEVQLAPIGAGAANTFYYIVAIAAIVLGFLAFFVIKKKRKMKV